LFSNKNKEGNNHKWQAFLCTKSARLRKKQLKTTCKQRGALVSRLEGRAIPIRFCNRAAPISSWRMLYLNLFIFILITTDLIGSFNSGIKTDKSVIWFLRSLCDSWENNGECMAGGVKRSVHSAGQCYGGHSHLHHLHRWSSFSQRPPHPVLSSSLSHSHTGSNFIHIFCFKKTKIGISLPCMLCFFLHGYLFFNKIDASASNFFFFGNLFQVDGSNVGWLLHQRCTFGGMYFFLTFSIFFYFSNLLVSFLDSGCWTCLGVSRGGCKMGNWNWCYPSWTLDIKLSDHLFVYWFCSIPFQAWVLYRESSWLCAILWIILLVCFGRFVSCPLLNLLKSICCLEKSYDLAT
jgi:hypothetical protein